MTRPGKASPQPVSPEHLRALLMEAEIGDVPTLDLHGYSKDEAIHAAEQFLYHEQWQGSEAVRIIHGRGTDTLRRALLSWIARQSVVVAGYRDMDHPRFQNACLAIALHRIQKRTAR